MLKKNGNFVIKKSASKYKNKWIEVIEDKVIRPDGKAGIFGIVKMGGGSNILPMDDKGHIYLVREFHYAIKKSGIESAHGGMNKGESFLSAAKRELKEEVGIIAKKWTDLGTVQPFTTLIESPQKLYLAENLTFGKDIPDAGEDVKIIKVKLEKAVEMVMKNEITYVTSCLLILKANEHLKRRKKR